MEKLENINSIAEFNTVVNELNNIYKEWLEAFPFDLEIFKHLRADFEQDLPIVKNNQAIWDKDKNEIVIDLYSNKTFQQFLAQKTTKLLSEINTLSLLENGKINDIDKHKLDFIIKERRLKLQSQVKWSRLSKPDYINYISEWLEDEMKFIDNITPYFEQYKPDKKAAEKRPPAKYYALYHRILIELGEVSPFDLVNDSELPATEIKNFAIDNYGFDDGQSFYREFAKINTMKIHDIAISFGKGYKQKIIDISQNNAKVIKLLEKYPN